MTGRQLGEILNARWPEVEVLYTSGYSPEFSSDFPLKEGVNFMAKPYQLQSLVTLLRERLNSR